MTLREVDPVEDDPDVQAEEAQIAADEKALADKRAKARSKKGGQPAAAVQPVTEEWTQAQIDAYAAEKRAKAAQEQADKLNNDQIASEEERQRNAALDEHAARVAEEAKKAQLVPDDVAAKALKAALQHPVVVSLTTQPDILLMSDGRQGVVLDSEGHPNALNQYSAADTLYLAVRIVHDPRVPDANGVVTEPLPAPVRG